MYRSSSRAGVKSGRPRDPRIDEAILSATRSLLVEVGYGRLSLELVAKRAGVTRPAIYRRWPSKMHLVHEAVFPAAGTRFVEDTGDFEADLRRLARRNLASYARPEARAAMTGLLTDLHDDTALRHSVLDSLESDVRAQFAVRVRRAADQGEVKKEVDASLLLDVVVGAIFHRVVARGETDESFADSLVSLVMDGSR
jgi:AcrR family transcriptional regulator